MYTIQVTTPGSFEQAVDVAIEALEGEGFGVLSDIDVQATLRAKLGEDFRQYRILGACNPPLAHEGLTQEPELGALLPCNVIVYETDAGDVVVQAIDPERLVGLTENDALTPIAGEVRERFERVLATVGEELGTVTPV